MMKSSPSWLPAFTLKESRRSKRITLKISAHKGLEIIVPQRTSKKKAFDFLTQKLDWVQKHLHLLTHSDNEVTIPTTVKLLMIGEEWQVITSDRQRKALKEDHATCAIILRSDLTVAQQQCYLKTWLIKKAKHHLPERLHIHSDTTGLSFASCSIRLQRSRWGSCSRDRHISLNAKLLLLPEAFADYVMIHELCHTLHFNHSPQFWQQVANYLPLYQSLCVDLKKIEQELPNWLY